MLDEIKRIQETATCLHDKPAVDAAFDSMATAIKNDIADTDPIVISVLNGGLISTSELLLRLDFPLRCDYLHASRYGTEIRGDQLTWVKCPSLSLQNETVLIIDDILDEGITLKSVVESCQASGAKRVLTAVLVQKEHNRSNGMQADYVGLKIEDKYVFGYGLDYKGYLRNVAGIFAIDMSQIET